MKTNKHALWKCLCLLFVAFVFAGLPAKAQTMVVDGETGDPVTYASVYDKSTGKYLGVTDGSGFLPEKARDVATIGIQHINYQAATVEAGSLTDGRIALTPLVRNIKEVTVDKGQHDYVRLKVYVRQLAWMTDTLAKATKAICHFYFKASKASGKPTITILSGKSVYNKDILSGKYRKMVRGVMRINPEVMLSIDGPKRLKALPADTVTWKELNSLGGNWGREYARFDWKNMRCSVVEDSVWATKPFTVPLTSIAVSNFFFSETYDIHHGAPKIANLTDMLFGMRITHKKTSTSVDIYNEAFVLDVDYASKEDLEREKNATSYGEFVEPEGFAPFNESVLKALENMRPLTAEEKAEVMNAAS
jgi:hypothetical protein